MKFKGKAVFGLMLVTILFTSLLTYSISRFIDQSANGLTTSSGSYENKKLEKAYEIIKARYLRQVTDQQLMDGAIDGMLKSLKDPYSTYMDQKTAKQFMSDLESSFSGIGAEVTLRDGKVTIVSPIKGSPADRVGLRPNDQILKIDGRSVKGWSLTQAVNQIRGPKGSKVTLTIRRAGLDHNLEIAVVRDNIKQETVNSKVLPQKVGYLRLRQFAENTSKEYAQQLQQLEKKKIKGLIIDVRGNPGGLLSSVQEILGQMVPKDRKILMTVDKQGNKEVFTGKANRVKPYPIVVLIDKGSASASEILAGAMQESAGAKLIGERSFGKGTVQTTVDFSDGSNIKLTMAKWLTPKGNWIDQHGGSKGIKPDKEVKYPAYMMATLPVVKKPLKYDSNSVQVKNMQLILQALGYDPGRVDGYFDYQTRQALRRFQGDQHLKSSGVFDTKTANAMQTAFFKLVNDVNRDVQIQAAIKEIKKTGDR
jgi:carboxyl-terminal processing protease